MSKRSIDLSVEELAALGANAALRAAKAAQDTGLNVTGTVDFLEDGQAKSSLAERLPSGTVTLRAPNMGASGKDAQGKAGAASPPKGRSD
jgi:hypothetical protein